MTGPMRSLLAVRGLSKAYGGVRAVDRVNFTVFPGEMLAMIGPNGAGKSTCFAMIGGQVRPDEGSVMYRDGPITGLSPRRIWARGIGRTFQISRTFGSLTVLENVQAALLRHHRQHRRLWRPARDQHTVAAMDLLDQVGLADQAGRAAGVIAYGDIKRLELALTLASAPALLLMDEPTAGMAPADRQDLMALVRRLVTGRGLTVLFTEHDMDIVFGFADRVLVLDRGRVIAEGDPERVRADPQVQAVYLGVGTMQAETAGAGAAALAAVPPLRHGAAR